MYYKINKDSEYLQQIMTVYKWYERLVYFSLTNNQNVQINKSQDGPKTRCNVSHN